MKLIRSGNNLTRCLLGAVIGLGALSTVAWAVHPLATLSGSDFEIERSSGAGDLGANIKLDHPDMIDWASVGGALTVGVTVVDDENITVGNKTGDSAFGQGTSEDTAVPSVVAGGVPPNKSDLKKFGIYVEEDGDTFVNVFWTRVQDPTGTTNMDFEFNQSNVVSANGVTPVRTAGDLLLQYDLSNGGTNPLLFLSTWTTAVSAGGAASVVCEATNKFPCWGKKQNLSAALLATGSINNDAILAANAAGLNDGAGLSARTFGEAQFNLTQIVGAGECITFGSVYLKSRSSDSFTAALKDFIAPEAVDITNCAAVKIIKKDDTGAVLQGAEFTIYDDNDPVGTFNLTGATPDTVLLDGASQPVTCTTLANGECLITDIFAGFYCAEETQVPANHIAADPQCFEVDPAVPILTVEFINRQLGSILVKKADKNGDALAGAVFEVISANPADDDVPTLPVTLTENPTGYHCVDGLPIKDALLDTISYTISETTIPDGYLGASDASSSAVFETCAVRTVSTPADADVDLIFENERKFGAIKISKTTKNVSSVPATVDHPGVTFKVYDSSNVLKGTVVTDGSGVACVGGLDVGETYKVEETAPTGYAGESAKNVLVSDDADCGSGDEDTVGFHNTPLGKFTISYDSLPTDGHGATKATVTCTDAGIAATDLFDTDEVTSSSLNFETQAAYSCTIVIDP